MALENKTQKANRLAMEVLPEIVKETLTGGFMYTPVEIHSVLVKKGLVEINEEYQNEAGHIATRATENGIAAIPQTGNTQEEEKVMAEKSGVSMATGFEIEDVAVVKPAGKGGGGSRQSIYPFANLNVGQSFFVPATEEKAEPWVSLKSTVSSQNKKTGVPAVNADGTPKMRKNKLGEMIQATDFTIQYTVIKDIKNGVAGARVGRIK